MSQRENKVDARAVAIGRAMKGWSIGDLSYFSGIQGWKIADFESGASTPTSQEWSKLMRALSTEG